VAILFIIVNTAEWRIDMKDFMDIGGNNNFTPGKNSIHAGAKDGKNTVKEYSLYGKETNFEKLLKEYIKQGKGKLEKDLKGTREAIRQLANEKVKEFMAINDLGLNMDERRYLAATIIASMYQSFCYGYSIGRVEGETSEKIML
jgi:hypothetical protein